MTLRTHFSHCLVGLLFPLAPVLAQVAEQGPDMPDPSPERQEQILNDLRSDSLLRFDPEYSPRDIAADIAAHISADDRVFGVVVNGMAYPMEGARLESLPPLPSFWFSRVQFYPETTLFTAGY